MFSTDEYPFIRINEIMVGAIVGLPKTHNSFYPSTTAVVKKIYFGMYAPMSKWISPYVVVNVDNKELHVPLEECKLIIKAEEEV